MIEQQVMVIITVQGSFTAVARILPEFPQRIGSNPYRPTGEKRRALRQVEENQYSTIGERLNYFGQLKTNL